MAQAVWDAMTGGAHLAVQAGTGTGKSLAYLVPALQLAAAKKHGPVVVSTATIALQRQLVDRDLPADRSAARAARPQAGVRDTQGPEQLPLPGQAAQRP